jgi:hypothetical protein
VSGPLALLLLLAVAAPLRAAEDTELHSFKVNERDGWFELSARASVPADEEVRTALMAGVTINLRLRALVVKKHEYWFDENVEDLRLQRELSWNALSQRYVLRYEKEAEAGSQQTFPTLEEALAAAGMVDNWRVIEASRLKQGSTYQIGMQASLRRGSLPDTLRELTFWTRYWNHRSEWQTWTLQR